MDIIHQTDTQEENSDGYYLNFTLAYNIHIRLYEATHVRTRAVDRPLFFGLAWPAVTLACLDSDGGRLLGFLAWPGLAGQQAPATGQAIFVVFYCKNSKPTD